MNLVTRTTEYPNGTIITESFEPAPQNDAPYDQATDTKNVVVEQEPYTVQFVYHGKLRVLINPAIIRGRYEWRNQSYNPLLGGVELDTGQYKNFSLSEIEPV